VERTATIAHCSVFFSGLLFGLGLTVSGMINPAKVIGFLDLAGNWDPSLALVMVAALAVSLPAFRLILKQQAPLFAGKFSLPEKITIDAPLIGGAALFGIGWGLAGLCPGPALAAVASLNTSLLLFLAAMLGGMFLHRLLFKKSN
jgi:uncharacterized protein